MTKPPAPRIAVVLTDMTTLDDLTAAVAAARIVGMTQDATVEVHAPNAEVSISVDLDTLPVEVTARDGVPTYADLFVLVEEVGVGLQYVADSAPSEGARRRRATELLERIAEVLP